MRVSIADAHGIGVTEFSARPASDRDAAIGLRLHQAETCTACGVHPSVWKPSLGGSPDAVVAVWRHCRVCEITERAEKAGPPEPETPGWHLAIEYRDREEVSPHVH